MGQLNSSDYLKGPRRSLKPSGLRIQLAKRAPMTIRRNDVVGSEGFVQQTRQIQILVTRQELCLRGEAGQSSRHVSMTAYPWRPGHMCGFFPTSRIETIIAQCTERTCCSTWHLHWGCFPSASLTWVSSAPEYFAILNPVSVSVSCRSFPPHLRGPPPRMWLC